MNPKLMSEFLTYSGKYALEENRYHPKYTEWLENQLTKLRKKSAKQEILIADYEYKDVINGKNISI